MAVIAKPSATGGGEAPPAAPGGPGGAPPAEPSAAGGGDGALPPEVQAAVDKTAAYEAAPAGTWTKQVIMTADVPGEAADLKCDEGEQGPTI